VARMWTSDQLAHRRAWEREHRKTHPRRRYQRRTGPRAQVVSCTHWVAGVRVPLHRGIGKGYRAPAPLSWVRALPATRAECENGPRPCPHVSCKFHLYLDVNPETGSIKLNFPHLEPWELTESCALDVAERGGITLEEVGTIVNLTRERVRQVEVRATAKLRLLSCAADLGSPEAHA
jgi:hypothetical protein